MFVFPTRLVSLTLLIASVCAAQQGTIQGVVSDNSGAVISNAKVTVANVKTSVEHSVQTNASGFYSVPFLVPGTYNVRAEAAGFAEKQLQNLVLNVGATARADFQLAVGAVTESVQVSAAAAILTTETTTVGQVIDNKRVVELPLNGRNYLELAQLTVGVTPSFGSRTNDKGNFSALGARSYQTNIMLDGVDNTSRASGGQLGFEAQQVTPSVDAVQEFKVVTNNNSAEYGFRLGGTVLVQTKSGTNEIHGSLYEFLRNDKFAANNFFANAAGQDKTVYKRNQFGATVGGPIIRDRTFFFGSYEGSRIRIGENNTATVPLAARKAGDFSDDEAFPIYDPATTRLSGTRTIRDQFPGNRIPAARFDPVAAKVIALYPDPNLSGATNNFFFSPSLSSDTNQYDGRIDHNINNNHRVFFRYSRRKFSEVDPGPLPLPADGGLWTTVDLTSNSYVANYNALLTPSLNNELRFGYNPTDSILDIPWDENLNPTFGIKGIADLGADNDHGMTRFTPSGYAEVGARTFWPNENNLRLFYLADSLLKITGRHSIKFGGEFRRERVYRRAARFSRGQMAFNSDFTDDPNSRARTGDGMADFLLGLASGGTVGNANGEVPVSQNWSIYFQDDWKVSSKLTLNLGLRWDLFSPPVFKELETSPVGRFLLGPPGSTEFTLERPKDESDSGGSRDWNNFAPRVGLAYQATQGTVIRTGFGVFYGTPDSFQQSAFWFNGPPDFAEFSFPSDRLTQPSYIVSQGFPTGLFPSTTVQSNVNINIVPSTQRPAQYAMQWFFDLQQQIPFDTVVTASYIGSGTRQMVWGRNINSVTDPGPGAIAARRPYSFFNNVSYAQSGGKASYNALGLKAEKRFSKGFTFITSYTWSHNIDDAAGTLNDGTDGLRNINQINWDRGNSAYDIRHNFVSSFVWDLPFGRGRALGGNWHRAVDAVLGGWQLGGIFAFRSGQYFTPTVSGNPANVNGTNYAERLGDGNLPSGRRNIERWFDVDAFAVPTQFTYGNSGRNVLIGPGDKNMDLKIGKNFYFGERFRLEFRTEMFNFTNTVNFGNPNSTVNAVNAGRITSASAPRVIQFGLKLLF